ncbi:flagellar FlbD family protein [Nocardioides yefusunii]|uniref:Flagellar FlbD family protein n=1 Tax=Nocardioides yefusunii TaxID=2500546 RepID=A0ABW1QXZ4_9ACTN|nr:flagellar FlbD family protein [Nocardioides yefusunii]
MIRLTRLSGSQFVLNSDLIERVDSTPDTIVTLSHGTKYVVSESLDEVISAVVEFRGRLVAAAGQVPPHSHGPDSPSAPHLASVSSLADASPDADQHTLHGQDL